MKLNAATDSLRDYINHLPKRIIFDEISDPTSELFSDLDATEICNPAEASTKIPLYTKRKAIDLHLFLKGKSGLTTTWAQMKDCTMPYLAYKVCLQIKYNPRNKATILLKFACRAAAIIYIEAKPRSCSGFTL